MLAIVLHLPHVVRRLRNHTVTIDYIIFVFNLYAVRVNIILLYAKQVVELQ